VLLAVVVLDCVLDGAGGGDLGGGLVPPELVEGGCGQTGTISALE